MCPREQTVRSPVMLPVVVMPGPLQVLSQPDAAQQGFDPSIAIATDKLHLTLLMLQLHLTLLMSRLQHTCCSAGLLIPTQSGVAVLSAVVLSLLQVLSQPDAAQQGFDPSIFITPDTLHLTLLMLKLYSDEARHKAAQALQGLRPQVCQQRL